MKINIKKTKVMRASNSDGGRVIIMIEGESREVEQLRSFKYRGIKLSGDGTCEKEN